MADERTRWTDDRLDDFAADVRGELGAIRAGVERMQADELRLLRERATRAESEVRSAGEERSKDAQANRVRRIGYAFTICVPLMASAMGALIGALIAHAF